MLYPSLYLWPQKKNGKGGDGKSYTPGAKPDDKETLTKANINGYQRKGYHTCCDGTHDEGKNQSLFHRIKGFIYAIIRASGFTANLHLYG